MCIEIMQGCSENYKRGCTWIFLLAVFLQGNFMLNYCSENKLTNE